MESKDQMKNGINDRNTKMSENEKAKALMNSEAAGTGKKFGEEKPLGGSGQANQTGRTSETGYSSGTNKQSINDPKNPTVRVTKRQHVGSSDDDFDRDHESSKFNTKNLLGLAGLVAGGLLLFKGVKKAWPSSKGTGEIRLHSKQTIKRSREELYAYWRNLENLPNFMSHIKEIREIDERRSRWTAEVPGGMGTIDWEAVIQQDLKNNYISWRSVANSDIENSGEVRFEDAPGGMGTIVETTIFYQPPAGNAGKYVAKMLNPAFEKIVKKDLKQFKKYMEKGGYERERRKYTNSLY